MTRCSSALLGWWRISGVTSQRISGVNSSQRNSGVNSSQRNSGGVNNSQRISGVNSSQHSEYTSQETNSLQGVEFCLLECGGVLWNNVVNTDVPLTNFTSFQMYEDRVSWDVFRLIRFSAWRGNIIEFVVENQTSSSPREMDLSLEGWCTLHCIQVRKVDEESADFEFNFGVALQESLYTNQSIKLQNEVLNVNSFFVPDDIRLKLEGLDPGLVNTIVFYLYNEALPQDMTSEMAVKVSEFVDSCDLLPGLGQLCTQYAKAVNIRNQIIDIFEDLRAAVNQVLSIFGGRICSPSGQVESGRNKSAGRLVISQPARLAASIKLTSKNVVFVCLKIVQFCVRFEELKPSLSPQEQSLIVKFAKSRTFMLLNQLIELMKALKYATVDLSSQARQDLALYFVEEVEEIATFFTKLGDEFKKLLDSIIEHTAVEREILCTQEDYKEAQQQREACGGGTTADRYAVVNHRRSGGGEANEDGKVVENGGCDADDPAAVAENVEVGGDDDDGGGVGNNQPYMHKTIMTLRIAMLTKEILSLKRASDQLGYVFSYLKQEKDAFSQQPEQDRIRELSRQLEQLVDEIPLLVLTLEKTATSVQDDEMLDDCGFLFEFTSQASSVFSVINFVRQNKDLFRPILELVRSHCYQENIEQCLVDMGLVNPPSADLTNQKAASSDLANQRPGDHQKQEQTSAGNATTCQNHPSDMLSDLSRKLHSSPRSRDSSLASLGYELYTSKQDTDMTFELHQDTVPPVQVICNPSGHPDNCSDDQPLSSADDDEESAAVVRIAAHRVVVCARCAWFQRALASGMKEDRERKIVLRDCSPQVFRIFLQFIYCGLYKLDLASLSVQVLVDLLLVADRYEVPVLVDVCEESLCARLEEDNAIPLLVLAEQFNAYRLRKECFEYIAARPDLVTPDSVEDLPPHLKQEIVGLHSWVRPQLFSSGSRGDHQVEEALLLAAQLDSDQESGDHDFNIFS